MISVTKICGFIGVAMMLFSPAFASTTITLRQGLNGYQGTTDAWLNAGRSRDNYGGDPELYIQWNQGQSDDIVLKFDLTDQIPQHQRILSATLKVWYFRNGNMVENNAMTIKPYRLNSGAWWDENSYIGQFGTGVSCRYRDINEDHEWTGGAVCGRGDMLDDSNGSNKIKKYIDRGPPDAIRPPNWVPFDVTQTVRRWNDGETNNGFLMLATGLEGSGVIAYGVFYSRNESGSESRPTLIITYEAALLPIAEAGGPYTVGPGQTVMFDGSSSYDPDGGNISA